jgi:uncharacterized protein (DUF58 family)
MTTRGSRPRLNSRGFAYLAAAVVSPFASLALGDPGPVLVALPVAVAVVIGLSGPPPVDPVLTVTGEVDRVVEGSPVKMRVEVQAGASTAQVTLDLPPGARMLGWRGARRIGDDGLVLRLVDGVGVAEITLVFERWGSYRLASARVETHGPLRLSTSVATCRVADVVVVLPETERVRQLVEPLMTNMHAGDLVSAARGAGAEMSELRTWQPADPPRAINWRASARSDQLWVTDRYADRNGDLILVVDSVTERGAEIEKAVGRVVRIAASLVKAYGQGRHRLGLVSFSGYTRWFGLDSGGTHQYRLLEAVMRTQAVTEPVWMAVDRVLERTVHRPSMVVFVTPLVTEGIHGRILQLAGGGVDVGVVAVDPDEWIETPRDPLRALAHRIWRMERQRAIDILRSSGVAVGDLWEGRSLGDLTEEMDGWRRRRRQLRT